MFRRITYHIVVTLVLFFGGLSSTLPASMQTAQVQTTPERREEALQLLEVGVKQLEDGYYQQALTTFEQALVITKAIDDKILQGRTLNNIGYAYEGLGQYSKALDTYQQALAIRQSINDQAGVGVTLNNIGVLYDSLGRYAQALESYKQALDIAKKSHHKEREAATLNNMGSVHKHLAQYSEALRLYEQALKIQQEIKAEADQGITLNNIGSIHDQQGNYPKALKAYQQALAIHKRIDDKSMEATTLNNIGQVYTHQGQYQQALASYQLALTIVQEIDYRAMEGNLLNNIAFVDDRLGQYPKALDFYQQALAIRRQIGDKLGQGITLNNIGFVYILRRQFAEAEKQLFAAIEVWESMRSGLTDDQKISIFEPQAATYRFLQQALIAQNKNNMALEVAERGRAKAFVELLTAKLSPNPEIQPKVTILNIKQIQQIAWQQKATLVEYSVNKSLLYIWVVKPTGEVTFKQVDLKTLNVPLAEIVNNSRRAIGAGGRGINVEPIDKPIQKQSLHTLYQILIEPIASVLPTNPNERVIFIPHESLFLVPFAALQDKNGKYLIEKHTILTSPAIQVLELTDKQRQRVTGKDALVMGNPTMPKVGIPPVQLNSLKGAEMEAQKIAHLLNTKAITGKDATKAALLQKLSSAKIIHLATHGLLDDPTRGIQTAIALAPSGKDNGLLTPTEIIDLKINAELVVLSACDTGRGTITGDGVIGLSRSLMTAGASSIIVSLWAVPDSPTADLMKEFYENWQTNPDKAQALRNAMLTTMKKHPEPKDWAAFTLMGEAE
jgi:CHAT domain-containing protein/Flp pilus assembly protein TadD